MPWECGYFDALRHRVAILPLVATNASSNDFRGREYLSLYPYVSHDNDTARQDVLWIQETPTRYVVFREWLNGKQPADHS